MTHHKICQTTLNLEALRICFENFQVCRLFCGMFFFPCLLLPLLSITVVSTKFPSDFRLRLWFAVKIKCTQNFFFAYCSLAKKIMRKFRKNFFEKLPFSAFFCYGMILILILNKSRVSLV